MIASGGVGTLDHLVEGVRDGHATAVLAASIFHFGEFSIGEAKAYMAKAGLPMRLDPSDALPRMTGRPKTCSASTISPRSSRIAPIAGADKSYTRACSTPARPVAKKFGEEAVEAVIAAVEARQSAVESGSRRRPLSSVGLASRRRRSVAGCDR